MKRNETVATSALRPAGNGRDGSVMLVTILLIAILMLIVGTTMMSTVNKYFTAYQWASWQEALQGAESGADIAMAEMRKDSQGTGSAFAGWTVTRNNCSKQIDSTGYFTDSCGNGNYTQFTLSLLQTKNVDSVSYTTQLSPHGGEGNRNLSITATIDAPASLNIVSTGAQWLRVRSSGSVDVTGPSRVSEERLDNRLRKLSLLWNKITGTSTAGQATTTRSIELVAKPVTMFTGALTAMVQIKLDKTGNVTDSFNSEDTTHWPLVNGTYDLTISHDPTSPLGKNGDVESNAFPIKHDHTENMDINGNTIWGNVGNNDAQIKNLDPAYYTNAYDPVNNPYGLNNANFGSSNPNSNLIKTAGGSGGGDVSGAISIDFYRDLPAVPEPTWTSGTVSDYRYFSKVDKGTADLDNLSTNPAQPTHVQVGTPVAKGNLTLGGTDKWTLKAPKKPGGWTVNTPTTHAYVEIWVTGDIKLDDGGTVVIQQLVDGSGVIISDVTATIYFDHNLKVGESKETKTNAGGFDNQTDDAKNLLLFGITQPDSGKLPKDEYIDPLGNDSLYTPYKASGNIVFWENDFTGAIYAPDHNIVFNNTKDGKGKRKKRKQDGNEYYGSFVGRTIHSKNFHNFHFDESLDDSGPARDWGYVSWFEHVDVDHR